MQRNAREEWLKHIRRERNRLDEIDTKTRIVVPVEKPIFAGWDIHLELENDEFESYKVQREHTLIMEALQWCKPKFVREVNIIKWLRRHRYVYVDCKANIPKKETKSGTIKLYGAQTFIDANLSSYAYKKLPTECQTYFEENTYTSYGIKYVSYELDTRRFPVEALTFKVKKAYWKALNHIDGQAKSEYDVLDYKLWGGGTYTQDLNKATNESRYRWKPPYSRAPTRALCHDLAKLPADVSMDIPWPVEMLDAFRDNDFAAPAYTDALAFEEQAFKKHKVYRRREYEY